MRKEAERYVGIRRTYHSEYGAWKDMKQRCLNVNDIQYKYYGGRGIKICDRWLNSFENFLGDMGPKRKPWLTLDRIDNNGNYEFKNCRWASYTDQNRNKSNRKYKGKNLF